MGEDEKEFVLHWDGHAGYVTERFSGLLARQALVDVTLICEEQKLRVHKLVLASSSLYFEEMLEQDLGQEPIIVLKDLNFEVLKAMVEFMYCGETTISQKCLPSLLIAARLFKVNELEYIAKQIVESQETNNACNRIKRFEENGESKHMNKIVAGKSDFQEIIPDKQNNNQMKLFNDIESEKIVLHECCYDSEREYEHHLYEDPSIMNDSLNHSESMQILPSDSCRIEEVFKDEEFNDISKLVQRNESLHSLSNGIDSDGNSSTKCCDSLYDECRESSFIPCPSSGKVEIEERYSSDSSNVESKVGQCLKVYTHKKRKSVNKIRNHLLQINKLLPELSTTKSIDLLNDSSSDDTSLNLENVEYVAKLSTDNIQSIVSCTLNEFNLIDSDNDMDVDNGFFTSKSAYLNTHQEIRKVEFISEFQKDRLIKPPLPRRSVRLSQQESEESTENNLFALSKSKKHKIRIISRKRSISNINGLLNKRKRRQHRECEIQDLRTTPSQNKRKHSPRRSSKLGKYRSKTSLSSRIQKKLKAIENSRVGKSVTKVGENVSPQPVQLNTIATVNRSWWGDMTDVSGGTNEKFKLDGCSTNMEIPFAVGLLPLRTALEKMQAMPDYQPRKTRSSVAPVKPDCNSLRRKNNNSEVSNEMKKHRVYSEGIVRENDKTVSHIEIRTEV